MAFTVQSVDGPHPVLGEFVDYFLGRIGDLGIVAAVVYADRGFGGAGVDLLPGSYNIVDRTVASDTVNSVKVPRGWTVTLFKSRGLEGASKTFTADAAYVGDDFNDQAASIQVSGPGSQELASVLGVVPVRPEFLLCRAVAVSLAAD
jgi:hypothetical protein